MKKEVSPDRPPITVTDSAMDKVADLLGSQPEMVGVRVYVYGGGCSGMQHSMTFADVKEDRDIEIAPNLLIDPCLLYTSPSPRDATLSRMPSSA